MKKFTVAQYEEMFDDVVDSVKVCEDKDAIAVYMGNEDCPFTGVEYADGTFSICGLGCDCMVTEDEMQQMLEE